MGIADQFRFKETKTSFYYKNALYPMNNIIECINLTHYYGKKRVYENLNFSVGEGQIFGVSSVELLHVVDLPGDRDADRLDRKIAEHPRQPIAQEAGMLEGEPPGFFGGARWVVGSGIGPKIWAPLRWAVSIIVFVD